MRLCESCIRESSSNPDELLLVQEWVEGSQSAGWRDGLVVEKTMFVLWKRPGLTSRSSDVLSSDAVSCLVDRLGSGGRPCFILSMNLRHQAVTEMRKW